MLGRISHTKATVFEVLSKGPGVTRQDGCCAVLLRWLYRIHHTNPQRIKKGQRHAL